MTTRYSTRRSLIASILILCLCFTTFIGTTFAWFTDSVTSANNIIKSGNLDVELYYQAEGQTDWTKVTSTTNIFKENALWEPGHTEVVKLKVVNEGSLALKYTLGVNVASEVGSVNVNDKEFKLSDFIKFGIVDGAQTYTRDQAIAAVDATATALKTAYNSTVTSLDAKNDTDSDEKIVTMVVYMPTTVGNEANAKTGAAVPTINLGINLFATQLPNESDSFGQDYDIGAPIVLAPTARPATGTAINLKGIEDVTIGLPADVVENLPNGVTEIGLSVSEPVVDATSKTIAFASIELVDQNGDVIDLEALNTNTNITVTLPAQTIFAPGETVVLYHDGEYAATAVVKSDKTISYEVAHLCEVSVEAVEVINTVDSLIAAAKAGGSYKLGADLTLSSILVVEKSFTLLGEGHTLTSTAARAINVSGANGVVIKDLTINCTGERAVNVIQNATGVTLENVTATAANYTVNVAASAPGAVVTIKNSTLNGLCTVNVAAAETDVTITDSTINCNDNNTTVGESYAAINLNKESTNGKIVATNTTVNVTEDSDSVKGRNSAENGVVTINGSTADVQVTVAIIDYPGYSTYHGFATLQAAIEFASKGDTVTLLRDVELTETVVIPEGKSITLNLNGKTVTAPAFEAGTGVCAIQNKGTLTVTGNGTIKGSYTALYSNGNLTIENGTFTATAGFGVLIDNIYGTEASVAVINGGTFTGVGIYNPTDVTVNGGTFNVGRDPDGASDHISDEMTLFISPTFDTGAPNTANVTLNGGTFNGDVYVYDDGITETVFVNNGATIKGDVLDNG